MADPSDMLHKPRKIAEPTLFSLLVWALCQSWCLKTCQSASLFVSRSFQCNDSQVVTLRRPVCQLLVITLHLACFSLSWLRRNHLEKPPLLTWPLGKSSIFTCAQCFPGGFFPRLFFGSRGFMVAISGWKRARRQLSKIWMAASLFTDVLIWERLECFPPWAPVGTEVLTVGKKAVLLCHTVLPESRGYLVPESRRSLLNKCIRLLSLLPCLWKAQNQF